MDELREKGAPRQTEVTDAIKANGEKLVYVLLALDDNNKKLDTLIEQKDRQFENDIKSRSSSFKVALLAVLLAGLAIYIDTSKMGGESAILNSVTQFVKTLGSPL